MEGERHSKKELPTIVYSQAYTIIYNMTSTPPPTFFSPISEDTP